MLPPFHLIFQHPGLIPFSQQKGLRVQKRVYFSPNQTKQTNINMIEEIFDSESGTKRIKVRWLRDEILNGRLIQGPVITKSPCKSGYTVVSVSYPQAWHLLVTGVTLSHTQKCLHHSGPMSSMFIPCQKVPLQNFPVFPFSRYWPHGVFSPL